MSLTISAVNNDELGEARQRIRKFPEQAQVIFEALEEAALLKAADDEARYQVAASLRKQIQDAEFDLAHDLRRKSEVGTNWGKADTERTDGEAERIARMKERYRKATEKPTDTRTPAEKRYDDLAEELNDNEVVEFIATANPRRDWREKIADLPGGNLEKALEEITARLRKIAEEFDANRRAKLDLETALTKMRADVQAQVREGAPDVSAVLRYEHSGFSRRRAQGAVKWPTQPLFDRSMSSSMDIQKGVAFLTWLFPKEVEARLEAEIRAKLESEPGAISIDARTAKEAALRAEWIALQRTQVRAHLELGRPLPNAHPYAALQIEPGELRTLPERVTSWDLPDGSAPTIGVKHSSLAKTGMNPAGHDD
jgi:hypothetical protein